MPVPSEENNFISENKIASGQQSALIFSPVFPADFLIKKDD